MIERFSSHLQKRALFNNGAVFMLAAVLIFMPLARGGVHLWSKTVLIIAVILMGIIIFLEKIVTEKPSVRKTPFDTPLLCLAVLLLVSAVFAVYKPDAIEAVILFCSYVGLFYVTIYAVRTKDQQMIIVYVILSMAILLSIIGLLKRFDLLPFSFWLYEHQAGSIFLTSTYGNHNHLAGYLEMAIPLFLGLFLTRRRSGAVLLVMIYLALFLITAHILTLSRGGWMSLATSLLIMFAILMFQKRFKRKKLLFGILAGVVVILLIVFSSTDTIQRLLTLTEEETVADMSGRSNAWKGVVEMIAVHPLLGFGPGSFATFFTQFQPSGMAARFYHAHNDYLHFIAEVGTIVLLPICWLVFVFFKEMARKLRSRSRQTWGVSLGAMTGVTALLLHSFGDFNLHIPANAILFTVLAAMVVGGPRKMEEARGKMEEV